MQCEFFCFVFFTVAVRCYKILFPYILSENSPIKGNFYVVYTVGENSPVTKYSNIFSVGFEALFQNYYFTNILYFLSTPGEKQY